MVRPPDHLHAWVGVGEVAVSGSGMHVHGIAIALLGCALCLDSRRQSMYMYMYKHMCMYSLGWPAKFVRQVRLVGFGVELQIAPQHVFVRQRLDGLPAYLG